MIKSVSKAVVYKVTTMLLVISTTGLVIRSIGSEGYVLYATIISFLGFLALIDFGLGNSCRNVLSQSYNQNEISPYNEIIKAIFLFSSVTSLSGLVILNVLYFSGYIESFLSIYSYANQDVILALYLCSSIFLVSFIFKNVNIIFFTTNRTENVQFVLMLNALLNFICISFYSLLRVEGTVVYVVTYVIVSLCVYVIYFVFESRKLELDWFNISVKKSIQVVKLNLKNSMFYFVLQSSAVFLFTYPIFKSHSVLEFENVATFLFLNQAFMSLISVFTVSVSPFWAKISLWDAANERSSLRTMILYVYICWFSIVVASYFFVDLMVDFLKIWSSGKIVVLREMVLYFLVYFYAQTLNSINSSILNGTGKVKVQYLIGVSQVILMIGLFNTFNASVSLGNFIEVIIYVALLSVIISAFYIFKDIFLTRNYAK